MNATIHARVPFTKERFYMEHVTQHGIASLERHLNRYLWALRHVRQGNVVLDAGCGSGYGDFILLNGCARVVGYDVSTEAIAYAQRKAAKMDQPRLTYELRDIGDLGRYGFNVQPVFDAVVCIEVIEHLTEDRQLNFLSAIKKLLKPEGRLMITTPEKKEGHPMTEFHENEFTRDGYLTFLGSAFEKVTLDDPAYFKIPMAFMLAVCEGVRQ